MKRRMVGGDNPFYLKFWVNWPRWSENADFQSIFDRSASAVTPSEKRSINTNRESITRFPMSLRWISYVAPNPHPGGERLKNANGRFPSKIVICLKKVCYKVSLYENSQRQRHSLAYLSMRELLVRDVPFYVKIWWILTPLQNADFQPIFARNDSAVTPSKISINTNRKSTTRFPMSLRWIVYVDPKPPKGGSKTQSVQNLNNNLPWRQNGTR